MDAEDVLQYSFMDAYRNIGSFNYKSTPGAWLKRIVINNCINHIKKKKMKIVDIDNSYDLADEPDDGKGGRRRPASAGHAYGKATQRQMRGQPGVPPTRVRGPSR